MEDLETHRVLLKVLSHKVRTPLSVVMNDLSYYSSLLPAEECDRPLRRCREIADLLSYCSLPPPKPLTSEEVKKGLLAVLEQGRSYSFPCKDGALLLHTAVSECLTLLELFLENTSKRDDDGSYTISGTTTSRLKVPALYSSLSSLTSAQDIESLSAPLVDLVFSDYAVGFSCSATRTDIVATLTLGR